LRFLGIGLWRSLEINRESFLADWSILINEIDRLIYNPSAILGILVLIIGLSIGGNELGRTVLG